MSCGDVRMRPAMLKRIMTATKKEWKTAQEILGPKAFQSQKNRLRYNLGVLRDLGFLKARHRPHEYRECGTKQSGPRPVEWKVSSEWGGL